MAAPGGIPVPDMSDLNPQEQAALQMLQKKQAQDLIKMYNALTKRCFDACCVDFTGRVLKHKETQCVERCIEKFLKSADRIGQRFAEQQQMMVERGPP